jgi:predicted hydrocarbon binding protein
MTTDNVTNILLDINKNIGSLNSQNKTIFDRLETISKTQQNTISDAADKNKEFMKIANKVTTKIDSIESNLNTHKRITTCIMVVYGCLFVLIFFKSPEKLLKLVKLSGFL